MVVWPIPKWAETCLSGLLKTASAADNFPTIQCKQIFVIFSFCLPIAKFLGLAPTHFICIILLNMAIFRSIMQIKWVGANPKNFAIGRQNEKITKICLHWIVGKLSAADAVFNNPDRQVSAHYGIGHTTIHQYVREEDTAYHAGNLTVNRQSIGIEHEGGPDLPISEDTHKTSIELVTDICRRYNIPADRQHILKHSKIKATQCPGTLDIDRIIREVQIRLDKFTQDNVKGYAICR